MTRFFSVLLLLSLIGCNVKMGRDQDLNLNNGNSGNSNNPGNPSNQDNKIVIVPNSIYVQSVVNQPVMFSVYIQNKSTSVMSSVAVNLANNYSEINVINNECLTAVLAPNAACRVDYEMNASIEVQRQTTLNASSNGLSASSSFIFKSIASQERLVLNSTFQVMNQGSTLTDELIDYVVLGQVSAFQVVSHPANGVLTLNSATGAVTYIPNSNFAGVDTFTYKATGNNLTSNTVRYQVLVQAVATAPIATAMTLSLNKNTPRAFSLVAQDAGNYPLSYIIVTPPQNGTLSGTGANRTYTPNNNFVGTDSFSFKVNNGSFDSNTATINISVLQNNNSPIASNSNVNVNYNSPTSFNLVASDADGDTLSYIMVTAPQNGTLSGTGPSFIYTPNAGFSGTDSLSFKVSDGTSESNTSTLAFSVSSQNGGPSTGPNSAPVASNQAVATQEDNSLNIVLVATDVNNNSLTYTIVTPPQNGTLSGSGSSRTYTPNSNYFGTDSFTFKANDGLLDSNLGTINISISSINDAPVASNRSVTGNNNTAITGTFLATDVDGNPLTYSIVNPPSNGALIINGINFSYTANSNFSGTDSFSYRASDGSLFSNTAVVSLTVNSVVVPPVANSGSFIIENSAPANVTLQAMGGSGALTYIIVTPPQNGTLSGTGANRTYTPNANFTGMDSFSFKVTDGVSESEVKTISLTITPSNQNQAPVASPQSIAVVEDSPTTFTINATDPENSPLTVIVTQAPQNGTLTFNGTTGVYTPNPNFNGTDTFSYQVSDGTLTSNIATATINVSAVNDAPALLAANFSVNEDTSLLNFIIPATDPENSPLTYSIVTPSANGTLSYNNGTKTFSYTPNNNFVGTDSFTVSVSDGLLSSTPRTYSITVNPVNDAPIANAQTIAVVEDAPTSFTLSGSDPENSPLQYIIVTQPTNGVLSGSAPSLIYTPNPNFNGSDSFSFKISDGVLESAVTTITLSVSAVNDAPIAFLQTTTTQRNIPVNIYLDGSDAEGDSLTFIVLTQPSNGTLSGTGGALVYTPNSQYVGTDSFTFKINDGTTDSTPGVVNLVVQNSNNAPVAVSSPVTVIEDTPTTITLNATDADGDPLTYTVSAPIHGTITGTGPNFVYTPHPNFNGTDSFIFSVNDEYESSLPVTITVNVSSVNDAPVITQQTIAVVEDTAKAFVLQAQDTDGDTLIYTIVTQPQHGVLSGTAPSLTYTPNANFSGSDSFSYKVSDGTIESAVSTVSISISNVNDAPIANAQSVAIVEDTSKNIILTATDTDGDILSYIIVTAPTKGVLVGAAPNLTYIPNANINGSDSFSFKVNDGTTDSNIVTVSLSISAVNDAPVANPITIAVTEDTNFNGTLNGTDVDANTNLTYTIIGTPSKGTVTIINLQTGAYVYTPNANLNGSDSFSYKVNDGTLDSNIAIVTVNISAVNDVPIAQAQSLAVNKNQAKTGTVLATDVDSAVLTYSVVTQPTNGTLVLNANGIFTYTPANNFTGIDSFSFRANDGIINSSTATVSIVVTQANIAPIAQNQTISAYFDQAIITGQALATDANGDTLNYSLISSVPNLTFNSNGSFSYTNSGTNLPTGTTVNHQITSDYISGYAYQIQFTNNGAPFQNWTVCFDYPFNVENPSNADIHSDSDKPKWKMVPKSYNQIVYTGETISINWNASPGNLGGQTLSNVRLFTQANADCATATNQLSTVSFTYKANDGQLDSNNATITLNMKTRDNELKIATNPTQVPHSLTDYSLMIDLQTFAHIEHLWSNVQTNGADLVVTGADKKSRLAAELRNFNKANRTGQLWFKSSITSNFANTFYLHYNNSTSPAIAAPSKTSLYGSYNVWANNYVGVWDMHLSSSTTIEDSTVNQNHFTKSASPSILANGFIDQAVGFNLSGMNNDLFTKSSNSSVQINDEITISSWVYPTASNTNAVIMEKESSGGKHSYALKLSNLRPHFIFDHDSSGKKITADNAIELNQWSFVVGSFNATTKKSRLYVNGVLVKEGSASPEDLSSVSTKPLYLGAVDSAFNYYGYMDEIKLSSKALSAEWIATEYNMINQVNTFWLIDDETIVVRDNFNRADSTTVGNSWGELEGCTAPGGLSLNLLGLLGINITTTTNECGYVRVKSNQMEFYNLENPRGFPESRLYWSNINNGKVYLSFYVDFFRKTTEDDYAVVMAFGENNKAVGELIWGSPSFGLTSHTGFGVVNKVNSIVSQMKNLNHRELVIVYIDYSTKKFNVYLKGAGLINMPFTDNTAILNKLSIITNEIRSTEVPRVFIDNVVIKHK